MRACLFAQLCLTLCDPRHCGPPGFSVHGISQARILAWVVISFSRDHPNPGIEPTSSTMAGCFFTTELQGRMLTKLEILIKKINFKKMQFMIARKT